MHNDRGFRLIAKPFGRFPVHWFISDSGKSIDTKVSALLIPRNSIMLKQGKGIYSIRLSAFNNQNK